MTEKQIARLAELRLKVELTDEEMGELQELEGIDALSRNEGLKEKPVEPVIAMGNTPVEPEA